LKNFDCDAEALAAAVAVAARCLAVRTPPEARTALLDRVWHRKHAAGPGGALQVTGREAGGRRDDAPAWHITAAQVFFGDLAIVRADATDPWATTLLTLFEVAGAWRVAGEVVCDTGVRQDAFRPRDGSGDLLQVLDVYYRAVEAGDAAPLRAIFSEAWHMKNHERGQIVAEDKPAFLKRVAGTPLPGYCSDRQIADVQVVGERMAWVRIDKPSVPVVTVFTLMWLAGAWQIVDKSWSEAKPAWQRVETAGGYLKTPKPA
jgi:hypothetical protein